ncbi:unnamed protein product [Cylindrotheca closterium]|uniref:Dolichol kinase n=1 Tax=Cylindrotheca closterium TaxID=2856 RepID=A0AAD2CW80_9STRA|nr:unnamed protein product [Cylindrotheca closterium]
MESKTGNGLWTKAASVTFLVVLVQVITANFPIGKENRRRIQHALTGHLMVQVSYIIPPSVAIGLCLLGAGGMYSLLKFSPDEFRRIFGELLRKEEFEGEQLPGAFYFLLGTASTVAVAKDINTARYAVECLAIADPLASWVGSNISSLKLNANSSLSGCLACFVGAWCVGYLMLTHDTYVLSIGALVCSMAEAIDIGNDNFSVPVLTALAVENLV